MAAVEDCGEAGAGGEGGYHYGVQFVVDYVSVLFEVYGVDYFAG